MKMNEFNKYYSVAAGYLDKSQIMNDFNKYCLEGNLEKAKELYHTYKISYCDFYEDDYTAFGISLNADQNDICIWLLDIGALNAPFDYEYIFIKGNIILAKYIFNKGWVATSSIKLDIS